MHLMLDAWLERSDPRLRVLDARSGEVLWQWHGEAVRALLESGRLHALDLQSPCALPECLRELLTPIPKEEDHG